MEHAPWSQKGHPFAAYWNLGCAEANAAFAHLIKQLLRETRGRCVLQLAGDPSAYVFLPVEGWLMTAKVDPDGARQIVDFALPGDVLDPASASMAYAAADVVTLGRGRLAMIPREGWQRYLVAHPSAAGLFARQSAARYARMAERMLRLGKSSGETRIAYAICELFLRANPFGLVTHTPFHLPVTQQVLGEFVGLSSVHVNRTIRAMARAGVLTYRGQLDVVIHDLPTLAAMAQIDPTELQATIIPSPG
ncbi:helix-turn-helix domain-containing protein [Rhodobacterales bacterium LSUCC0031]|nr:helix-turn-helix domain-containing protein [Rhodobacterales bacterium LSUCC0031]